MAKAEFTETIPRFIGYARVSTQEQDTSLQLTAMRRHGVESVFEEKRSAVVHRPELERMLAGLLPGDVVVVYKVDRLARSLWHLLEVLQRIEKAGGSLRSLTEPFDTGSPMGRLFLQMLGSFAEFERAVIRERCAAGRIDAMERGVKFGRPRTFDYEAAADLRKQGLTWDAIGQQLGRSRDSVRLALRYRRMAASGVAP